MLQLGRDFIIEVSTVAPANSPVVAGMLSCQAWDILRKRLASLGLEELTRGMNGVYPEIEMGDISEADYNVIRGWRSYSAKATGRLFRMY